MPNFDEMWWFTAKSIPDVMPRKLNKYNYNPMIVVINKEVKMGKDTKNLGHCVFCETHTRIICSIIKAKACLSCFRAISKHEIKLEKKIERLQNKLEQSKHEQGQDE